MIFFEIFQIHLLWKHLDNWLSYWKISWQGTMREELTNVIKWKDVNQLDTTTSLQIATNTAIFNSYIIGYVKQLGNVKNDICIIDVLMTVMMFSWDCPPLMCHVICYVLDGTLITLITATYCLTQLIINIETYMVLMIV